MLQKSDKYRRYSRHIARRLDLRKSKSSGGGQSAALRQQMLWPQWRVRQAGYLSGSCVAALSVVAITLSSGWFGEQRLYHPGRLSHFHRLIENDCARCHTSWAPRDRLLQSLPVIGNYFATGNGSSINERSCVECHAGDEHYEPMPGEARGRDRRDPVAAHQGLSCSVCHPEHRGDRPLTRVSDAVCTNCHQDLEHRPRLRGSGEFFASITRFAPGSGRGGHPEFAAVARLDGTRPTSSGKPLIRHGVEARVGMLPNGAVGDLTRLHFPHKAHLDVGGVLNGRGELTRMQCDDCHALDDSGRYMRPIVFEQHCRECHGLYFDAQLAMQPLPPEVGQVPHERMSIVRGFLTNHFVDIRRAQAIEGQKRPFPGPADEFDVDQSDREELRKWVESIEKRLREGGRGQVRGTPRNYVARWREHGGCAYCHVIESQNPGIGEPFSIAPPAIPNRWLPHSAFSHDSHRELDCNECHQRQRPENSTPAAGEAAKDLELSVATSQFAEDVLLPSIEVCRRCHNDSPIHSTGRVIEHAQGASATCVECHTYHRRDRTTPTKRRSIDEVLQGRDRVE